MISRLEDGIDELNISGRHFSDSQERVCTIVKDRHSGGYQAAGYAANLGCEPV